MTQELVTYDQWHDAYVQGWQGILSAASFAHPAKVAYSLAGRIYQHLKAEGWLWPGCQILDPFGGIGGFALHALLHGCHYTGCEIEEKFAVLASANIARWVQKYRTLPGLGSAVMLQGDSRELPALLTGHCAALISSPPYAAQEITQRRAFFGSHGTRELANRPTAERDNGYGTAPGQLGAMREGDFSAVVASPPYTDSEQSRDGEFTLKATKANPTPRRLDTRSYFPAAMTMPGQLGQTPGNDFWSASRLILQHCFALLAPGGHAVWVLKAFVRNGQIVDFPSQWRTLCESLGFVTLHEHQALLVEEMMHHTLFDGMQVMRKEKKSFFRRLHEKKYPHTAINCEVILCLQKPTAEGLP